MYIIFMILVIVGLGSIHHELRNKAKNDERIINRLDLIIQELDKQSGKDPIN